MWTVRRSNSVRPSRSCCGSLWKMQGMICSRELLLDRVWSDGAEYVDENALSVSIKRLRDKLGAEHAIRTVYGIGYRWE